jgi:hypothetical protein
MNKRIITSKEEARQYAIEFQTWAGEHDLSWEEVRKWGAIFIELAEKYDLQDEFRENGII